MVDLFIGAGILFCAYKAMQENRLLVSALWLALTSALVSWMMYRVGAAEVAVVELSVGAGLVTVLFVFAINIAGDESLTRQSLVPRPLAWFAVVFSMGLLVWMIMPALQSERMRAVLEQTGVLAGLFRSVLWNDRRVDTLMQVVLFFAGALAVLGLIGEPNKSREERE
ncbi:MULTISPECIES: hydrogenase subunit MbhD domain-containing protein [Anaerolinea]|uniref:hydrogenase subunit MbhD domain-containing protein n=1 Tax=Anaerolinea TaxID=233189 RepID=UPI00263289FA|nr:hydrogenase subunit MbhD domain-containing protein [Anaerolinea thermophila]